jgi:hypothetical protein
MRASPLCDARRFAGDFSALVQHLHALRRQARS